MDHQTHKINRSLLQSWMVIITVLLLCYVVEVVKHERTWLYLLVFALSMLVPLFIILAIYKKKPDWQNLGYCIVFAYSIMYGFVLFTGNTQMVFVYILPMLSFLLLYHKPVLILVTGGISLIINAVYLAFQLEQDEITVANSRDVEIRFAAIILCFAGSYVCTRLYDGIWRENKKYDEDLREKNRRIQDMTMQTIITIANTIDAKDEYTKGHSRRVSEYSAAIAKEMGLPEERVGEIRSIALLHDIGKIGVPDGVLNKPGKLTQEEYELMKEHAAIGGEILKDIGMLPGIDIGAKHHHERYDGKGYPNHLKGEEIPQIARIIAVADAFDAMTSTRVYRKHLTDEQVMEELKKGRGMQFDPVADDAMIRLLEEKRLQPIDPASEEYSQVSDVSKIWSRVLEKGESKYKDKSEHDELTGLYNRSFGEKLIRDAVNTGQGCLLAVDVDHFRAINGEAGYLLGDIFLRIVAGCLEKIEEEKIAARYGGDEFAVFLPNLTDKEKIKKIVLAFMELVKEHTDLLKTEFQLTVSVGARIVTGMKNSYPDVYLDADRALYLSKKQGGNCLHFFENAKIDLGNFGSKENVDLMKFAESLKNPEKNAYLSESEEFQRAYKLLKELLDKNEGPLQLILFSIAPNDGINVSLDSQNEVMEFLEKAIDRSIKGRDYTFRYSSTQRMVLLIDAEGEGAVAVTSHIMREFYKFYDKNEIHVSYGMTGIS